MRKPHTEMIADLASLDGEMSQRFGWFCRQKHPEKTRENVAAELGVCISTIDKVLSGERPPNGTILKRAAKLWKWEFVHFVLAPFAGPAPTPAMTLSEIQEARATLEAMRERFDRLEGKL